MTDEEGMLTAYQHGAASNKDRIRELEAERNEARMKSLADLGQAQDAYEAQKKAEAERDKLKAEVDDALRSFEMTGNSTDLTRRLYAALGETEKLPRDFLEAK